MKKTGGHRGVHRGGRRGEPVANLRYLGEMVLGQVQFCQVGQTLQLHVDGGDVVALQQQNLKRVSEL